MHATDSVTNGFAEKDEKSWRFGLGLLLFGVACALSFVTPAVQAFAQPSAEMLFTASAPPDPGTDPFAQARPSAAEVAARVDKHYNHLHSLQLSFMERYRGMGMERIEQGTLLLKKPGFMRWSYTRPKGKIFIIDKQDAYAYTPGDAQAQRFPVEKLNDLRSPLRFLLGHTELSKEMGSLTVSFDGNMATLRGVPVGLEKRMTALELTVGMDGGILDMKMKEIGGAETVFQFYGENDKAPISKKDFVFQPPAGVKVVDGLSPM